MSDAEKRANELRDAADRSAGLARNLYFTFLLLAAYIIVIIGSTTDEQLLRISPVTLPILNVGMPIVAFYALIPWLVLLFHFNLLLQIYLLSRKLHRFNAALRGIESESARLDQQARLFPFPFSHMLVGSQHGRVMRFLFALMVWVTLLLIPLLLLVWAQIRFLPYHDETVTWGQRIAVLLDLALTWVFWPIIIAPDSRAGSWWRGFAGGLRHWVDRLRNWRALGQASVSEDPTSDQARGAVTLTLTSVAVVTLSVFVALVPGEALDRFLTRSVQEGDPETERVRPLAGLMGLTTVLFDAPGAPFHRNLRLVDKTLTLAPLPPNAIADLRGQDAEKRAAALQQVVPLNLSNRDLRFADLRNLLLPKADLSGANLDGADLKDAILSGADLRPSDPEGGGCVQDEGQRLVLEAHQQSSAGLTAKEVDIPVCVASLKAARLEDTRLDGASLLRARLQGSNLSEADLRGAKLRNARLEEADLFRAKLEAADLRSAEFQGARLRQADLQRANLDGAKLHLADLSDARLDGAKLTEADLSGADLDGASLIGADFVEARLLGASLVYTRFMLADLRGARLTGADLSESQLQGAELRDANLKGAILSLAGIGGTNFGGANLDYADLRGLESRPLDVEHYESLKRYLTETIEEKELSKRMGARLQPLLVQLGSVKGADRIDAALCSPDDSWEGCRFEGQSLRYAELVAEKVLAPLACDSPPVARAFLSRMTIRRGEAIPSIQRKVALARRLLAPGCEAGLAAAPDFAPTLEELCGPAQLYDVACELPAIEPRVETGSAE